MVLAGFLGGYRGLTRDAYGLDLRQFVAFCDRRHLQLFEVRRSDIETFGRELEVKGRATATIARRLCTVTAFHRYAEQEDLNAHSPAVHVRRPRTDYESHAIGLDRNEVGTLLVAAGLGPATAHAWISLLALNGLRVSEAIGADIETLRVQRGHRTLAVLRKGGKTAMLPRAPRTPRAVDLAVGEGAAGPTGTCLARPPRHLHRVHPHRRSRPLTRRSGRQHQPAGAQSQQLRSRTIAEAALRGMSVGQALSGCRTPYLGDLK
ncbi:MAG: site-specific integrase [Actinomycetota bacterium]|nr:site-specific integrase [Actinomycetota bacterium]